MIRVGKTKTGYLLVAAIMVLTIALPILRQQIVHAATLTVDSILDTSDGTPGDGNCDDGAGNCTLRAAIEEANVLAGPDTINFNIPGAGVHTITPIDTLNVTSQLTIDGTTQPGANCGTLVPATLPAISNTPHSLMIKIAGGTDGSDVFNFGTGSDNSTIKGIDVNSAAQATTNIVVSGVGVIIECNYIGTDESGGSTTAEGPNTYTMATGIGGSGNDLTVQNNLISGNLTGIDISGSNANIHDNIIGTAASGFTPLVSNNTGIRLRDTTAAKVVNHNIISGNSGNGIEIDNSYLGEVKANYIGLAMNGEPQGNQGDGISIHGGSYFNSIGRPDDGNGNVISANTGNGVHIYKTGCDGDPHNNTVYNNYIGTNISGQKANGYGNHLSGVAINEYDTTCNENSVYRNTIGNTDNSDENSHHTRNIIAGNLEDGVRIYQSPGKDVRENPVVGNSIFGNGNLGINLAEDSDDDGVADAALGRNATNSFDINNPTANANSYLNSPTINSVTKGDGQLDINYDLVANPVDPSMNVVGYLLSFYINDGLNSSGNGEGQRYIGDFIVDGSETGATHSFVTSETITDGVSNITATTTALISNGCPCGFNNHQESRSLLSQVSNFFMPKASAEEITPDTIGFDLGPTSEFSVANVIGGVGGTSGGTTSSSSSSAGAAQLADTGQNITGTTLFVDTVAGLAVAAVGYMAFRSRRRHFIRAR